MCSDMFIMYFFDWSLLFFKYFFCVFAPCGIYFNLVHIKFSPRFFKNYLILESKYGIIPMIEPKDWLKI